MSQENNRITFDGQVLKSGGNPSARKAMDGRFFRVFRVTGADASTYLNGQFSNQVQSLKKGHGQLTTHNTAKGKTIALINLFRRDQDYLVVLPASATEKFQSLFELYLFTEDVQVEELPVEASLLCFGKACEEKLLEQLNIGPLEKDVLERDDLNVLQGKFFGEDATLYLGFEKSYDLDIESEFYLENDKELEVRRILNLYPLPGSEYPEEKILTPELDQGEIISYNKGCFVGQEVFARIRTYGRTNKTLASLELPSEAGKDLLGKEIEVEGKSKGKVTSFVRDNSRVLAMGYVPTALKDIGEEVEVGEFTGKILR